MSGLKPIRVELTEVERDRLEKITGRHSTKQRVALRGRVILAAAEDKTNAEIAREMKVGIDVVRLWRRRWAELQGISLADLSVEERLEDLPRPGAPPRLTADQVCQIEQMACKKPEQAGRPISQWTGREIADEMVKRGIVDHISVRHAARLLKKGVSSRT